MADTGGSVTLIFYRIESPWHEPFLNLLAAAAQLSSFTHVEIAIGDEAGQLGQMSNVARVFNDDTGERRFVELASRTGRNPQASFLPRIAHAITALASNDARVAPQYSYLSIGCSKRAENTMLAYARTLVGKPFSNMGMARSIFFPRKTDGESFFCAELVAAILKRGGLMSAGSNPGAATPESLHRLYKNQAAVTANPYTLRQFNSHSRSGAAPKSIGFSAMLNGASGPPPPRYKRQESRKRGNSPPRQSFRYVSLGGGYHTDSALLLKR